MATPNLGYGKQTEAKIDTVNQWMRAQPWWAAIKGNTDKLNDAQRKQILRAAQANGVVVDEGDIEIDSAGNLNPKGHKLRNTLIVAGLAGATLATMGAAGAFAGAGGAAGAGAGAGAGAAGTGAGVAGAGAAGAGLLPATAIGTGALGPIAGGAGLAGAGAGTGGALTTAAKIGQLISGGKGAGGYLDTAGQIAAMLGDISGGRAAGRLDEANLVAAQNRAALERHNAELAARQAALAMPGARASNSVRGDILANAKPFSWTGGSDMVGNIPVPKFEGGLSPALFSEATRTLGGLQSTQALSQQRANNDLLAPPPLMEAPQAGKLDSILNAAATVGGLASAIPYRRIPRPGDPDYLPPRR